jgi:hypothetical protein
MLYGAVASRYGGLGFTVVVRALVRKMPIGFPHAARTIQKARPVQPGWHIESEGC